MVTKETGFKCQFCGDIHKNSAAAASCEFKCRTGSLIMHLSEEKGVSQRDIRQEVIKELKDQLFEAAAENISDEYKRFIDEDMEEFGVVGAALGAIDDGCPKRYAATYIYGEYGERELIDDMHLWRNI